MRITNLLLRSLIATMLPYAISFASIRLIQSLLNEDDKMLFNLVLILVALIATSYFFATSIATKGGYWLWLYALCLNLWSTIEVIDQCTAYFAHP